MLKFRFIGGIHDGLEASSASTDPLEKQQYLTAMNFTEGGVIGLFFNVTAPGSFQEAMKITDPKERLAAIKRTMYHRYTATERKKEGDDEIVVMTFSEVVPGK